jgi:hypothetical protein
VQTDRPATILAGRYALQGELGRSGVGVTWRAADTVLQRTVAVKLLRPELGDDPGFATLLGDTARAVAAVSHPGLLHLLDTGSEGGVSYLVREHVEGESLRSLLERDGPLSPEHATEIATAILDATGAAHRAGMLHLDLKPDNVLLDPEGKVRLTDLGVGIAVCGSRPPEEAARLLAPTPLAPEVLAGAEPGPQVDVLSTGALLFQMLTGELPSGRPSARALRPQVPRELDLVVGRALAPDPVDRFPDAASFAAALRRFAHGREPEGLVGPEPDAGRRSWMRSWLAVPLVVALAAAAAIGLGLWLGRLELGGPLGIRPRPEEPSTTATAPVAGSQPMAAVGTWDPYGDDAENDSGAPNAIDGDPATAWRSENYFDAQLNKPGVGLLFDLGDEHSVLGFRLVTAHPGYSFALAVGDNPEALVGSVGPAFVAEAETRGSISPTVGRFVLLWITSVVDTGDGNRAEVAEFKVIGADA